MSAQHLTIRPGQTAVITGAASGFGLELARLGAKQGLNLVITDVQQDALDAALAELTGMGAKVAALRGDVSRAEDVQALADLCLERFGAPHIVINNAGVAHGGLIWEHTQRDWEWVLGVNLFGVVHGVRVFTPLMLAAAAKDAAYQGHIVNVASMAGLLNSPNMGAYNVSKHAVVSLSETLYQDLSLVTEQVHASVLCPYFVPTGISQSHRNRPGELAASKPTQSQLISQAIDTLQRLWGLQPIRIGAQAHLQDFYRQHGFVTASGVYDEDGIDHVEMRRDPAGASV